MTTALTKTLGREPVWTTYEHVRLGEQELPAGLLALLESRRLFTNVRWQDYTPDGESDREDVDRLGQAEAASSQRRDDPLGMHALMVDIDHDASLVEGPYGYTLEVVLDDGWESGEKRVFRYPLPSGAEAWLIPSTQPKHFHLYVDLDWSWSQIGMVLIDLTRAGVVEQGYQQVSEKRGFTALRLPWISKEDAAAALSRFAGDPEQVAF